MKVSPMIFNAEMVLALLDGRKGQTRRPAKIHKDAAGDPVLCIPGKGCPKHWRDKLGVMFEEPRPRWFDKDHPTHDFTASPYGQIGDLIYVRETTEADEHAAAHAVLSRYTADKQPVLYSGCEDSEYNGSVAHWNYPRPVRPSAHMFRWASRLTLKITDVRIERVQDISESSAIREGLFLESIVPGTTQLWRFSEESNWFSHARNAFKGLWDSIYNNWDSNPWVWVYEFEVIKQNVDDYLKSLDD